MTGRIPKRAARLAAAVLATAGALAMTAGTASATPEVVFNNNPAVKPGNVASLNISQRAISEFGGQVKLMHAETVAQTVSVMMSSWACGNLLVGSACLTAPGATFVWPITLNIYQVGANNQPGALIRSVTKNVNVPYRPSPSSKCPKTGGEENDAYGWYSTSGHCFNGKAFYVTYTLAELAKLGKLILPEKVIIGVAFNDSSEGTNVGQSGLNIGLTEKSFETPTVGSMPLLNTAEVWLNDVYLDATTEFPYLCERCTPKMPTGSTVGTFGVAGEWYGGVTAEQESKLEWGNAEAYQPVLKLTGTPLTPTAYVAIGDSLAFGYKETIFNKEFPAEPPSAFEAGYAGEFANKLAAAELKAYNRLSTINLGCPGETSGGLIGNGPLGKYLEGVRASKSESALEVSAPCGYHNEYGWSLKTEQGTASELEYAVGLIKAGVNVKAVTLNIGSNDELESISKCVNPEYDGKYGFTSLTECLLYEVGLSGHEYPGGLFTHILTNIGTVVGTLRNYAGYKGPIIVLGFYNPQALFLPGSDVLQKSLNDHAEFVINGATGLNATYGLVTFANPFPLINPQTSAEKAHIEKYTEMYNASDIAANNYKEKTESRSETNEGDIHPTALGYSKLGQLVWEHR